MTRDGILNTTAETFFHQLRDDTDFISLIAILASAAEIQALLGGKKGSKKEKKERQSKVEELEKVIEARREELGVDENVMMKQENRVEVKTAPARRARALLWAHLLRMELEDAEMKSGKSDHMSLMTLADCPELDSILVSVQPILTGLVNIALAHNWLSTSTLCMQLQPALVQALPAGLSPLAQLTGITPERATEMELLHKAEGKKWLDKWYNASIDNVTEAKNMAKYWPKLDVVSVEFKGMPSQLSARSFADRSVAGEKVVTPSAIVQLTFKCRYIYPSTPVAKNTVPNGHLVDGPNGHADTTPDDTSDEKRDVKDVAEDVKEIVAEKAEKVVGLKGKEAVAKPEYAPNGYAHAPHWPLVSLVFILAKHS